MPKWGKDAAQQILLHAAVPCHAPLSKAQFSSNLLLLLFLFFFFGPLSLSRRWRRWHNAAFYYGLLRQRTAKWSQVCEACVAAHATWQCAPLTLTSLHNKRRTTERQREGEIAPAATDNSQAKLINGTRYMHLSPQGKISAILRTYFKREQRMSTHSIDECHLHIKNYSSHKQLKSSTKIKEIQES